MKNELLPCPFCMSEAKYLRSEEYEWDIECTNPKCYLSDGSDWRLSKEEITEIWNARKDCPYKHITQSNFLPLCTKEES